MRFGCVWLGHVWTNASTDRSVGVFGFFLLLPSLSSITAEKVKKNAGIMEIPPELVVPWDVILRWTCFPLLFFFVFCTVVRLSVTAFWF